MRVVIQRVAEASVGVDGITVSAIGRGLLVLLGIEASDTESDIEWLSGKIAGMRIFSDADDKMNLSVCDISGDVLVVSQFTLHASTKKGNRPSFLKSAAPEIAEPLYEQFCEALGTKIGKAVGRGIFGADMKVALINDGPVTIVMDSHARE
ncbi:MAG: D-aminoacyl-tRNA deacylase [Verrucomicrobiota bacterium]